MRATRRNRRIALAHMPAVRITGAPLAQRLARSAGKRAITVCAERRDMRAEQRSGAVRRRSSTAPHYRRFPSRSNAISLCILRRVSAGSVAYAHRERCHTMEQL